MVVVGMVGAVTTAAEVFMAVAVSMVADTAN
jgi:hypothetical protein